MWKNVLSAIIAENIGTLKHYQNMNGESTHTVDHILHYVSRAITGLPWYFRIPVIMLAHIIGVLCVIATGRKITLLPPEKRSQFLRRVQFIPFFGMLNKLVRSMAFLKLFDCFPLTPEHLNGVTLK